MFKSCVIIIEMEVHGRQGIDVNSNLKCVKYSFVLHSVSVSCKQKFVIRCKIFLASLSFWDWGNLNRDFPPG